MKTIFYVATSIDGYITGPNGDLTWLEKYSDGKEDYGFHTFLDSIDTLVMGANTYRDIQGFGEWPYGTKPSYVVTHDDKLEIMDGAHLTVLEGDITKTLSTIEAAGAKQLWIVGGGNLAKQCIEAKLLDEIQMFVMPTLLGGGVPLFLPLKRSQEWELTHQQVYENGVMEMRYVPATA